MATAAFKAPVGSYTFTTSPRALDSRSKPAPQFHPQNIMFDKRVRRGASLAAKPQQTTTTGTTGSPAAKRTRKLALSGTQSSGNGDYPSPVPGRKHIEIQTEVYLEEITDRIKEIDMETQTDPFVDRPPTPIFVPAKTGIDRATQVDKEDMQFIFDFDREVEPIVEVIVGKTLEQAMMEVLEEEELKNLRQHQIDFEHRRNKELAEVQRLEEAERRRLEEKERRIKQDQERVAREQQQQKEMEAHVIAKACLADITKIVFTDFKREGHFYDRVQRQVESQFMPWLMGAVTNNLHQANVSRQLLDNLIQHAISRSVERHKERIKQVLIAPSVLPHHKVTIVLAEQDAE